jgi:hypothetical protein
MSIKKGSLPFILRGKRSKIRKKGAGWQPFFCSCLACPRLTVGLLGTIKLYQ